MCEALPRRLGYPTYEQYNRDLMQAKQETTDPTSHI